MGGWVGVGRAFSVWRWLPPRGGGRAGSVIIVGRPCGHRRRAGRAKGSVCAVKCNQFSADVNVAHA